MLPVSIAKHPYFHEDLDEKKAKEFLSSNADNVNFLFCKSINNKEFLFCYKASFRGSMECRVLKLTYNVNQKKIESGSLGNFSTLYAISQQLPSFLKGFADGQFIPIPAFKKSLMAELFLEQTGSIVSPLSPLSNDVVLDNIFSKIDTNSLFNAMLVSKSWYLLIKSDIPLILKRQYQAEKLKMAAHKEKVQFIFNFIKNELQPDPEGQGKKHKQLVYESFTLSQPEWYGSSKIICKIDSEEYKNGYLLIAPESTRWMSVEAPVNDDLYEKLLNVCKLGKNSMNQI